MRLTVRSYTEAQVLSAWDRTFAKTYATPAPPVRGDFLSELRKGSHLLQKDRGVLFSKDDLLAVAGTGHEKLMLHGIFAILGTEMANDYALLDQARMANLGDSMKVMIELAEAKKEEGGYLPGDVVRDANGIYYKLTTGRKWATFEHAMFLDFGAPVRPLEKMP